LKTFSPSITPCKRSSVLNINLPFQNRDEDIKTMARICLKNLKISKMESLAKSTEKTTLLTSSQMLGSKKTWLGNHFLREFNSPQFAEFRSELEKEFGVEAVETLGRSEYIVIDFRHWKYMLSSLPEGDRGLDLFVLRSLIETMLSHFPEDLAFWESTLMQ
jgi:hypothetical protein